MNAFKSALACSARLLSLGPALAADANEAAARLKALMEAQGATVSWGSLAGSGDDAILHGVKMTMPGENREVHLGTVEMRGIDDGPNGTITVDTLIAPGYSHKRGADKFDVKVTVEGGGTTGLPGSDTTRATKGRSVAICSPKPPTEAHAVRDAPSDRPP